MQFALEAAYQVGEKLTSVEVVESVLSRQIDNLEPTLTLNGYRFKDLVERFDAKPPEIKAVFNTLDVTRVQRNYSTKCCGAEGEVVDRSFSDFVPCFQHSQCPPRYRQETRRQNPEAEIG